MEFYLTDLETERGRQIFGAKMLALMTLLEDAEVEKVIRAWQAVTAVNAGGRIVKAAERDPNDDLVERYKQQHGASVKVEPEPQDEPVAEAELGEHTFAGYDFSPARRGPHAALQRALGVLEAQQDLAAFEAVLPALEGLRAWLDRIGQGDKAQTLASMVESRLKELTGPAEVAEPAEAPEAEEEAPWEEPMSGNGATEPEPMPIRDLLNLAMDQLGRPEVVKIMAKHGVKRIAEIKGEIEAQMRTALAPLLTLDIDTLDEDLRA